MEDNTDSGYDLKNRQSNNEILGAVTFNITELSRLADLYDLASKSGLMNISEAQMDYILKKYKEAIQDVSKLSHYMITVWELMGDEQFQEFFVFHHSVMWLCAESEEKKKTLFQLITKFRALCDTHHQRSKIESHFHLKAYKQWRDTVPRIPLHKAVQDAWDHCSDHHAANRTVLSNLTIPKDAWRHCQLDDMRLTNLVFQCLWSDYCMPYVRYVTQPPEILQLSHLRTLRPTGWLICDIISSYFLVLLNKSKDSCLVSRVFDTKHAGFTFDAAKEARKINNLRTKIKERKIRNILIPRSETQFHWSLVEIKLVSADEDEIIINHYDSLCGRAITSSDEINRYKAYAKEFLLKDRNCTLEDIKFQSLIPDTRPSQKNGCDCGVFVCIVAASLSGVLRVPLSDINQAFITERNSRASICASLLTGEMVPPLADNNCHSI